MEALDEDSVFPALLLFIFRWPVAVPLASIILFLSLRNRPSNPRDAKQFFDAFIFGGHRGSPTRQPENTIESMKQAKMEGADLIEFDVSLTKDGVAVLLHDDTLDRTTNLSGPIRSFTHKELQHCNCAAKFVGVEEDGKEESKLAASLPTLDELVKWAKTNKLKMLFDVKDTDKCLVDKLHALFEEYDLYATGIVCSFYPSVVYRIKRRSPRILTGVTWRRWVNSYTDIHSTIRRHDSHLKHVLALIADVIHVWNIMSWLPDFVGADLLLTERSEISESFVKRQETKGRRVCAWTVNDELEMEWMRKTLNIPFLTDRAYLAQKRLLVN